MVKHQPLQVYERQLCLSCLTGIYGCRWKRYQRSHDDSSKWECSWFFILCSSFLLLLVWSYFWLEAHNDYNEFNWLLYNRSGEWSDSTVPILTTTLVGFSYTAFLMILALCHIALGQQLNLYWIHKIGVLAVLLTTITGVVSIDDLWRDEWDIVLISLQSTGPFLHIGAVAAVTALGWLVAGQILRVERTRFQALLLLLYICVLLVLYLAPLTISSPCIMDRANLKPRPAVIGRRGAPMLAPENTGMSFNKALQQKVSAFETDVTVSMDGVPFLMRDRTLRRTTNVASVFPQRQHDDASLFNWTEIRSLNAGLWFLRDDPYWTVQFMTGRDRSRAGNQTVCSLVDLLRLAARTNRTVIFSLRRPPPQHPRYQLWIKDTLRAVQRSGIQSEQVMWTPDWYRKTVRAAVPLLQATSGEKPPGEEVRERGTRTLSLHYSQATVPELRRLSSSNVSLNVYPVNEPWLYSVLWCSGVQSVSSDAPHILRKVPHPIWLMSPDEYCLIWITSDLISAAIIIGIFIFQNYHIIRWKMSGMRSYNPEQIMLSAVVRRPSRDVNIMKEKLIFSEINNGVSSTDELSIYTEHGYEGYTRDGISR
ncbi:glycerophosphodiester phosphodiesterase domain-containing protein 5 isoform X1 [Astyanax mexicanus]|uniref:glycerophosphodiester phosphodiesterase domain-containing protein 5 isoform X1 n=1 Tax=Astyanax mexicanus TaxID=7994 RepID=UPI0020CAD49D|nr:glycerophosphodiester phosphodiesterase domain-containing protein 5 isoform X1 [Astyanax mexicanus]XP_022536721.2 glycerophosphodiester phosphodiesterase domain-containing protein 5 isoform X1 [Astyanax mexicanus]